MKIRLMFMGAIVFHSLWAGQTPLSKEIVLEPLDIPQIEIVSSDMKIMSKLLEKLKIEIITPYLEKFESQFRNNPTLKIHFNGGKGREFFKGVVREIFEKGYIPVSNGKFCSSQKIKDDLQVVSRNPVESAYNAAVEEVYQKVREEKIQPSDSQLRQHAALISRLKKLNSTDRSLRSREGSSPQKPAWKY